MLEKLPSSFHRMKDGRPYFIETWRDSQLWEFLSNNPEIDENTPPFGFTYLTKTSLIRRFNYNIYCKDYCQELKTKKLSELEIQDIKKENAWEYDFSLVALSEEGLVGIRTAYWEKTQDFWGYYLSYIDVHKNYRNNGIATELYKELDNSPLIKNKILAMSSFASKEGKMYAKPTLEKILKAKDYALVYPKYYFHNNEKPNKCGIFRIEEYE